MADRDDAVVIAQEIGDVDVGGGISKGGKVGTMRREPAFNPGIELAVPLRVELIRVEATEPHTGSQIRLPGRHRAAVNASRRRHGCQVFVQAALHPVCYYADLSSIME